MLTVVGKVFFGSCVVKVKGQAEGLREPIDSGYWERGDEG
jgi:hypothetical protein